MATYGPLSGSGIQALSGGVGALHIHIDTLPSGFGAGSGNPATLYQVGLLRVGDGTAWWTAVPIQAVDFWMGVPNGATELGYAIDTTGVIHVTEVIGANPFAGPQGPSGATGAAGAAGAAGAPGPSGFGAGTITTPPSFASGYWSWLNQGSASVVEAAGYVSIVAPAVSGDQVRGLVHTYPATPFVATALFLPSIALLAWQNVGLVLRDSASGKLVTCTFWTNGSAPQFHVSKWNSSSAFLTDYLTTTYAFSGAVWMRCSDNGTNRVFSFSMDGVNFIQLHSVARTDFITPNQIGFMAESNTSTGWPSVNTLLSWLVA